MGGFWRDFCSDLPFLGLSGVVFVSWESCKGRDFHLKREKEQREKKRAKNKKKKKQRMRQRAERLVQEKLLNN